MLLMAGYYNQRYAWPTAGSGGFQPPRISLRCGGWKPPRQLRWDLYLFAVMRDFVRATLHRIDLRLVAVILTAVGVRVVFFVFYLQSPFAGYHRVDHDYYRSWAIQIAHGDWLGEEVFEQAPLYPYLLGAAYSLLGPRDNVILVVQMLAGVLSCILVYACGRRLYDANTGLLAGLVAAAFGPMVFYECMIMKTFLSPLLTMVALYAALRYAQRRNVWWIAVSGAVVGLACLVRENHVLVVAALGLWVLSTGRQAQVSWSRRGAHLAVLTSACALMLLPSAVRNYMVSRDLVVVTAGGGEVFYMAHGPYATGYYQAPPFISSSPFQEHEDFRIEAERRTGQELSRGESSRYWSREAWREATEHPGRTGWLMLVKATSLLNDFETPDSEYYVVTRDFIPFLYLLPTFGWIAGLGMYGVVKSIVGRPPLDSLVGTAHPTRWQRYQLPVTFAAAHAVSVLLTYNFGRFRSGMIPVWILLAAFGLTELVRQWRSSDGVVRRFAVVFSALAIVVLTAIAFRKPLNYDNTPYEYERHAFRFKVAVRAADPKLAERSIREAIEVAPPDRAARSHRGLAELLEGTGRRAEAMTEYQTALELDPDDSQSYVGLGGIYMAEGSLDRALELFRQAIELDSTNAAAHYSLAAALAASGEYQMAVPHYERALHLQPESPHAHYGLARAAEASGDNAAAIKHYRVYVDLKPDVPQVTTDLAWLLATVADDSLRDGQEALNLAQQAMTATNGSNPQVLDTLAAAYAEAGRFDEAVQAAQQALRFAAQVRSQQLGRAIQQRLSLYQQGRPFHGPRGY